MTKPVTRKMAVDCLLWIAEEAYKDLRDPLARYSPFRCIECTKPIFPGDSIQFDHRQAMIHGGPHEYKNLWPIHTDCHKAKTARDVKANAKVKRIAKGGRKRRGPALKSKGFDKTLRRTMAGKVEKR